MTERPAGTSSAPDSDPRPDPLLLLTDVRRRFGLRVVLDGVTLEVKPGQLHLIVGPNGAGKTTLQRLAAGLLRCHQGTVRVSGTDPRDSARARRIIGFLGHQSALYDELTPLENLAFCARIFGLPSSDRAIGSVLDRLMIGSEREVEVRRLSRGTVQRVAIARSLLHQPRLLIWDEPLTGLDGPSMDRVLGLVKEAQTAGSGILLVSHDLDPLWGLEARVHLLHRGRIHLTLDTSSSLTEFRREYRAVVDG